MKLLALSIDGFRGIQHTRITFGDHDVIVGPNGSGKSTLIDALSLVFGRTRLVRELTEHDFYGSAPVEASRIRIVATVGGFPTNESDRHEAWFREGRAVPKWWNSAEGRVEAELTNAAKELCAQIGFAARFDLENLEIEQLRYFHDDDDVDDPFLSEVVQQVPSRLFEDIGYYVLPARRTWEAATSFASDLFRKAVATVGGIPAQSILEERDRLRQPPTALESDPRLVPLVEKFNAQLSRLLPSSPTFHLRVTATDSDSLLRALIPHYQTYQGVLLPVGRHGTGLLSLQTFILLLELGRERVRQRKPFVYAMEEPELHVPPGLQRRLVTQAISVADQTICTSHSPRVAGMYPATSVLVLEQRPTELAATRMLSEKLDTNATNAARKLYHDDRPKVIEALMQHRVLVPEGRSDYEWLQFLSNTLETIDTPAPTSESEIHPFGAVVGVVPTHESAVVETFRRLRHLRNGIVPIVDGDKAGDDKITELLGIDTGPEIILQWRENWTIEDVIGWILSEGDESEILTDLRNRIGHDFESVSMLVEMLKTRQGSGRLKTDYLAYEEIAFAIRSRENCRQRANLVLQALTVACLDASDQFELIQRDTQKSTNSCSVLRISP